MIKKRSPLRKGDKVMFVGPTFSDGTGCIDYDCRPIYVEVSSDWDSEMSLVHTKLGTIDRRQVIAVKRKKQRREFWGRECKVTSAHRFLVPNNPAYYKLSKVCEDCEIIRVREVRE